MSNPDWEWRSSAEDTTEQLMTLCQEAMSPLRSAVAEALTGGGLEQLVRYATMDRGAQPAADPDRPDRTRSTLAMPTLCAVRGLVGEDPPG